MSSFLSDLYVHILPPQKVKKRQLYVLTHCLRYKSDILGDIEVPDTFETDFASIPRIAWRYLDPEDPCILYPSVIHDYLYSLGGRLSERETYDRAQADLVFREAMGVCGARWDQRAVAYNAVRIFGASHWKESP